MKLWEKYRDVKKKKERVTKGAIEERENFERELGKCFNISAKNAIQTIQNDKNRSSQAKEIDIIFLGDQLGERKMKFTISDKKYEKEIKVGQERKEAQEKMLNNQEKESS